MKEIGALEEKDKLGHLLDLVEAGEEIIITRRGKPVARMVSAAPAISESDRLDDYSALSPILSD
jgi:prevent-host-death family protein